MSDLRSRMVEAMARSDIQFDGYDDPMALSAERRERYEGRCNAALTAALAVLDEAGYQITRRDQMTGEEFEALFPRSEPTEQLRAVYAMGKAAAPDVKEG